MTLEEKVGQIFISIVYEENFKEFLEETKLGNVIYFQWSNNLRNKEQVTNLSAQLRETITEITGIPPIISVDQEGGRVSRLHGDFTPIPPASRISTPEQAREIGKTVGKELNEVGITMNFAPVVDLQTPDSFLKDRCLSPDPYDVTILAEQLIEGMQEEGVLSVIKHFPGCGKASTDPHQQVLISELDDDALIPFSHLQNKADGIMTGHVVDPEYGNRPATLSEYFLTTLLREGMGYDGLIISDSLTMNGVLEDTSTFTHAKESVAKSAIRAFLAGCDMLILGKLEWAHFTTTKKQDQELIAYVIKEFAEAVIEGIIPEERLDASLGRILHKKNAAAGVAAAPISKL